MRTIKGNLGLAGAACLLASCGGDNGSGGEVANGSTEKAQSSAVDSSASADSAPKSTSDVPAAGATDTLDGTNFAAFNGDATNGEKVFLQCRACHVLEESQNRIGPSLAGLIGREAGKVEGFHFTPANANSGIIWTPEKMFQYLENPQRVIPGTKMAFPGLPKAQDRADLIAFLQRPAN